MNKINYLFIGKDPYFFNTEKMKVDENAEYKNIQLKNYPTENVAFFPYYTDGKRENNNEWLNIVTFRRIIGLLSKKQLSCIDDFHTTFQKKPEQIAFDYQKKGVYFCNLNEIKANITKESINSLIIENDNKFWEIDTNTKVLCFGSDAIKYFKTKQLYKNHSSNLGTFPHPSSNNYNVFWKHYDKDFNPIIHNLDIDLLPPTP
ncbi:MULTISPECIES: hypothetical protein [Staphylococcus]|uniref:Uncharacterized protein n=1 Tax=Staphylococcus edaphicus TaxID=1955013 RepID=A0A2C6VG66_9STAP|nr:MULTISPECIES: hypothetical protein [Staphylococcus]MDW3909730.1 hypothetical protein [Staphylococcus saprophyticus]PHK49301.1 hypothetical protein BTJ66_09020 [Staphylococcus edaphicus]UQW80996.1 hypothetical protein MNY58_10465 [Staphylococcus edaphicus]